MSGENDGSTRIYYKHGHGLQVSKEVLKLPIDELARKVYELVTAVHSPHSIPLAESNETSIDFITERLKEW